MATRYQDKKGYWYVQYKDVSGKWKSKYCGKNATASDAETIRKSYDAIELNTKHNLPLRIVNLPLKDALEQYIKTEIPKDSIYNVPRSRKTIIRNTAILKNLLEYTQSKNLKQISQIDATIALSFFEYLKAPPSPRKPATIRKYRQVLSQTWKVFQKLNYCKDNPWLSVPNPKRTKGVPRFFSENELETIFTNANEPYKSIFRFLYYTGIRTGELCNLRWSDYVESGNYIIIKVQEGNKTKRVGTVPLNPNAVDILRLQKQNACSEFIFINGHGRQLDNGNIYNHFIKIKIAHNIPDCRPHTFRHTFASHLAMKGASLQTLQKLLRHSKIEETMVYAHLTEKYVANAVTLLSSL